MAQPLQAFSARDLLRLKGVHPLLIEYLGIVFADMREIHAMFVVMGVRTAEQQHALWLQGRGRPGRIVTYLDGYRRRSNHQTRQDGLGHAVDCAFIDVQPFAELHPWPEFGRRVEALGLVWGGRYKTLVDRPHVELP